MLVVILTAIVVIETLLLVFSHGHTKHRPACADIYRLDVKPLFSNCDEKLDFDRPCHDCLVMFLNNGGDIKVAKELVA